MAFGALTLSAPSLRVLAVVTLLGGNLAAAIAADAPLPPGASTAQGIAWAKHSLAEVQAFAAKHKVPVLAELRFDGCPGCAALESGPFRQSAVINLTRQYVNIQVNYLGPDGEALRKAAGLVGTPSLVVFDPAGSVVDKLEGPADTAAVAGLLQKGLGR